MSIDSPITDCAQTTLAVLAGGEGRRMGGPKVNLTLDGQPILERLLDRLDWPGPTLLVTAPGRPHPPGWRRFISQATDPVAGQGPLRGVLTALEHSPTDEIVILPLDMPNITLPSLAWLTARLRDYPAAAAVMIEQPLPAAFRTHIAQPLVRAQLSKQRLALRQLAESSDVIVLPSPSDWPNDFWINLNTPTDLTAYTEGVRPSKPRRPLDGGCAEGTARRLY